jgi:hypothetical protein
MEIALALPSQAAIYSKLLRNAWEVAEGVGLSQIAPLTATR